MPSEITPIRSWPVHDAPEVHDTAEEGIALCLSGGGFRAMLFHAGALWRLNQLGYLPRLDRVSSVSGGSITAGVLGMGWDLQERLINWGYAVCDAAMRAHVDQGLAPPDAFPYPDAGVGPDEEKNA